MRARLEAFDPRVAYRMIVTYEDPNQDALRETSENVGIVRGRLVGLAAYKRIVRQIEFEWDAPAFAAF